MRYEETKRGFTVQRPDGRVDVLDIDDEAILSAIAERLTDPVGLLCIIGRRSSEREVPNERERAGESR